jgi:hypothetical protein
VEAGFAGRPLVGGLLRGGHAACFDGERRIYAPPANFYISAVAVAFFLGRMRRYRRGSTR